MKIKIGVWVNRRNFEMTNLTDLLEEAKLLNQKPKSPKDRIKAEEKYTLLIDLAQRADDPILAAGLNGRGLVRRMIAKRSEAYVDFLAAFSTAQDDDQRAEALLGQADIHRVHHGNVPAAHQALDDTLEYAGEGTLLAAKAHDFRGMLREYNEQRFSEAIESYIKGRTIGEELVRKEPQNKDYHNRLAQIGMHLANCYFMTGSDLDKAVESGLDALKSFREMGDTTEIINALVIVARIAHGAKDLDQALSLYQESLDLANRIQYDRAIVPIDLEIAGVYLDLDKKEEAVPHLKRFVRGMRNDEITVSDRPSMKPFVESVGKAYDLSGLNVSGFSEVRKLF